MRTAAAVASSADSVAAASGGGGARAETPRATIDPAQLEELQRRARQTELARFLLMWLLAADGPVNWVATAESPDGKADVLEITPASGPAATPVSRSDDARSADDYVAGDASADVLARTRGGRARPRR